MFFQTNISTDIVMIGKIKNIYKLVLHRIIKE